MRCWLAVSLLLSVPIRAQDPAAVAALVHEKSIDANALPIGAADAVTRATAARVALVRDVKAAVPALREALAAEKNAEAAREQIRALVVLGDESDIAFAAKQLARFPASIDSEFTEAIARRGAPGATTLYLAYLPSLRDPAPSVKHALWGRSALASSTAARLLGAKDVRGFAEVLDALEQAKQTLDANVATAALGADSTALRAEVVWHLAHQHANEPANVPESAAAAREDAGVDEAFGRELLRRIRGAKPQSRPEWLQWLRTREGRARLIPVLQPVLTQQESDASKDERLAKLPPGPKLEPGVGTVAPSAFRMALEVPAGLTAPLLAKYGCTAQWIGQAMVHVDRAGRVQSIDEAKMFTDGDCEKALTAMLRLTLVDPFSLTSGLTAPVVFVKPEREACFDEGVVDASPVEPLFTGDGVIAPVVQKRVQPGFPASVRNQMHGLTVIVVEALVTRTGCVRGVGLIKQSPWPELNGEALMAVAKWKFAPATLEGQPVDVHFLVALSFRH